ncbi:hypothetical protein L1987_46847 [Smallanthus sonchifolius]|uniref:Uncharacterized protein n=1 Tax=Smallanthus sonchifolius TaxID=185202 RepID=A0ACB9G0A5_9ASTR|nr:hypothetical protein L1987_46847 [Smallanthus sonchifolius]
MLKEDMSTLGLKSSTTRARVCDVCHSSLSTIFCEARLVYLCTSCDSQVHASNMLSLRHKRVSVCEACEQAPAAFICKADAALLCTTCDAVIHFANPLSQHHHRIPVMPFSGSVYGCRATEPWSLIGQGFEPQESEGTLDNENEDEAASWLIFDSPVKNSLNQNGGTNGFLFDGNEYLDLVDYNSCQGTQFSDDLKFDDEYKYMSVVPVQEHHHFHYHHFQNQKFQFGMECESSNGGYEFPASHCQNVSMSLTEVGSVRDSTITEVSISNARTQMPIQLTPVDREARVLKYREKKKTRTFEKTIRYASRKAYA